MMAGGVTCRTWCVLSLRLTPVGRTGQETLAMVCEMLLRASVLMVGGMSWLIVRANCLLTDGGGALLLAWKMGLDGAVLKAAWKETEGFLMARPWFLFAALVLLPALPVPTSALLFLAGTVWRDRPLMACAICLLAMALNMTWTYWAAAGPGRGWVVKLLSVMGFKSPELPKGNDLRVILLMRLTPGFPFFIQNYLLGFFRVPFRLYLPVSVGCSGMISVGVVLSSAGVADGNLVPVISGVALIVVDQTVADDLILQLNRFALDLIGDPAHRYHGPDQIAKKNIEHQEAAE